MKQSISDQDISISDEDINKRFKYICVLLEIQQSYSEKSCEYSNIKIAIAAVLFYMEQQNECAKQKLSDKQKQRLHEVECCMRKEYGYVSSGLNMQEDICETIVSGSIAYLRRLLEQYENIKDIYDALQCSVDDLEKTRGQKEQFFVFYNKI